MPVIAEQEIQWQTGPETSETAGPAPRPHQEFNEFDYRPMPVIVVLGVVLALLSGAGVFVWLALPLCLVAFLVSLAGWWVVRRSHGDYSGGLLALSGMVMSAAFLLGGIGWQVYSYRSEVPEGYTRVNFVKDISSKGVPVIDGKAAIDPEILALDGKKVFLKGYIYQTNQLEKLKSFLLVKDNQSCCFGANPALWDRLGVIMNGDKTIDYHAGKVAIAGTFRVVSDYQPQGSLDPIYLIEGEKFLTRVSDF